MAEFLFYSLGGIVALTVLVFAYIVVTYNRLVGLRVRKNEAWSDITVQMKRRYDLIPNLVEVVKGYAKHESDTLAAVIAARSAAVANTGDPAQQAQSENILTGALRQLLAVSEAYPDLKANSNFSELTDKLNMVEDQIQKARRFYNGNVRLLNVAVQEFPAVVVANMFAFQRADFFELEDTEMNAVQKVPNVKFD